VIPKIKKILFATDLSETARDAYPYAASQAISNGADIVILHVVEKAPGGIEAQLQEMFGADRWKEIQEEHDRAARHMIVGKRTVHDLVRMALSDLSGGPHRSDTQDSFESQEILITHGDAVAEEILKTAAEKGCDLIVLGAHKGLFGRTALGTVAKEVLHTATVPVLVVPPARAAESKEEE